ncbi:hypothetical protein [Enterococcus faecalis]|uniref:hypothetical protein n=1 Tax=Enterococcus faecalis TaxID=1351 RepID=UPI003D14E5DC
MNERIHKSTHSLEILELCKNFSAIDWNRVAINYLVKERKEKEAYIKYLEGFIHGLLIRN